MGLTVRGEVKAIRDLTCCDTPMFDTIGGFREEHHLKYAPTERSMPSTQRSSMYSFSTAVRNSVTYSSSVGSWPAPSDSSAFEPDPDHK